MKYHLTQDSTGFLFPPDHHLILPWWHLRFTYYLYPFLHIISMFVTC